MHTYLLGPHGHKLSDNCGHFHTKKAGCHGLTRESASSHFGGSKGTHGPLWWHQQPTMLMLMTMMATRNGIANNGKDNNQLCDGNQQWTSEPMVVNVNGGGGGSSSRSWRQGWMTTTATTTTKEMPQELFMESGPRRMWGCRDMGLVHLVDFLMNKWESEVFHIRCGASLCETFPLFARGFLSIVRIFIAFAEIWACHILVFSSLNSN